MAAVNFRKIDIDQYDPENFVSQEDLVPPQPAISPAEIVARGQQVRQILAKGDYASALQLVLDNPPYGADDATKVSFLSQSN